MRLATPTNGSPMRARRTRARTCCVRVRACIHVRLGAHVSAPTRASTFRRRGPRVARLTGVLCGVGVQREHRRVEHRARHHVGHGMRRFRADGAPPRRARSVGARCRAAVVRGGTADARACARTHVIGMWWSRVADTAMHSCAQEKWYICIRECVKMHIYLYVYVYDMRCIYIYIYIYL